MNKNIKKVFISIHISSVLIAAYTILNKCFGRLFLDDYCMPSNNYFNILQVFQYIYQILAVISFLGAFFFFGYYIYGLFSMNKAKHKYFIKTKKYIFLNLVLLIVLSLVLLIIIDVGVTHLEIDPEF